MGAFACLFVARTWVMTKLVVGNVREKSAACRRIQGSGRRCHLGTGHMPCQEQDQPAKPPENRFGDGYVADWYLIWFNAGMRHDLIPVGILAWQWSPIRAPGPSSVLEAWADRREEGQPASSWPRLRDAW
jgi:hypothetical protein